jgi:phosphoribosylformylglycinamidine cyclo-ligase
MVAVVAPDAAGGVLAHAAELGLSAWVLGHVRTGTPEDATTDLVSGTKGVHGGAVHLTGTYREA